ncbi:hypothetical protein [Caulobacter sp. NIBR1757]|uniref:hypothetical protein n=1 Tax=Caulobacter sp. NIBR1757 TaxID=3016000 RepID=UPI0022F0B18E|nr:hypothetical protein [Caulobacter sp. NIBR1757]WGM38315.1 hypothetical protein AMEJIAPC_01218 [Caulobacter sp. NIBR1757]
MPARALTAIGQQFQSRLEVLTGLTSLAAAGLCAAAFVIERNTPELCSQGGNALAHCPVCYAAAAASLIAIVGGVELLRRRLDS